MIKKRCLSVSKWCLLGPSRARSTPTLHLVSFRSLIKTFRRKFPTYSRGSSPGGFPVPLLCLLVGQIYYDISPFTEGVNMAPELRTSHLRLSILLAPFAQGMERRENSGNAGNSLVWSRRRATSAGERKQINRFPNNNPPRKTLFCWLLRDRDCRKQEIHGERNDEGDADDDA